MSIVEEEIIGSQSEESEAVGTSDDNTDEVLSLFGIEKEEEGEKSFNDKTPAKEDVKEEIESKTVKVKHNKEEVEVDISDDKLTDHLQRSLALDKERERRTEYEKHLDRVANLQGFKDHSELVANLARIEQEQQEKEKNAHNVMLQELRQNAEDAGLDPDQVENYLNNHPLMKQAQEAIAERELSKAEQDSQAHQQTIKSQWDEVFTAFPDIEKRDVAFNGNQVVFVGGKTPEWLTPEVKQRLESGYKPIDAVTLSNLDKIQAQTKAKAQQRVIKEQQLGLRSKVEGHAPSDNEESVPQDLAFAFKAFGMTEADAKKYMK